MSKLTLWLIRHGQTRANLGHWEANPQDTCLTRLGREQALKAAEQIIHPPDLIASSPLRRARDSAAYLRNRWPETPGQIWPIEEFVYLSPQSMNAASESERQTRIKRYWELADPCYCDGTDAESFEHFIQRVQAFHHRVEACQGFVVVIGHAQFFKAWLMCRETDFEASSSAMKQFRQMETSLVLDNGEIFRLCL